MTLTFGSRRSNGRNDAARALRGNGTGIASTGGAAGACDHSQILVRQRRQSWPDKLPKIIVYESALDNEHDRTGFVDVVLRCLS